MRRTLPPTGRAALRAGTHLFSEVPVRERFEKMLRVATRAVESMDGDEILACDLDATVAEIMKPFRFELPAITEAGITTKIDPPTQLSAPTPYVIRFFIPFTGEPAILKTLPITPARFASSRHAARRGNSGHVHEPRPGPRTAEESLRSGLKQDQSVSRRFSDPDRTRVCGPLDTDQEPPRPEARPL